MGTTFIKYPWEPKVNETITPEDKNTGQAMYIKITEWCENHADGVYTIDPVIYAKGVKVNFKNTNDTKRLKEYMNG